MHIDLYALLKATETASSSGVRQHAFDKPELSQESCASCRGGVQVFKSAGVSIGGQDVGGMVFCKRERSVKRLVVSVMRHEGR